MSRIIFTFCLLTAVLFAKEFSLQAIDGKSYHISLTSTTLKVAEFPDKIIILDFFGANCTPCIAEMPALVSFQKTFGESVQFVGIQAGSKRDDAAMRHFANQHAMNYPVINLSVAEELIRYTQENGWNGALPFKLIADFNGDMLYTVYGEVSEKKLLELLRER